MCVRREETKRQHDQQGTNVGRDSDAHSGQGRYASDIFTMAKATKRPRADVTDAAPSEPGEAAPKRSHGAQPPPLLPQQQGEAANAPVRDRREVMADVARR